MRGHTLTSLTCSGSLTIALLLASGDRAEAAPTSPTEPATVDSNNAKSELVSLSVVKTSAKDRVRSLDLFGCACSGCVDLVRQLEESANVNFIPQI